MLTNYLEIALRNVKRSPGYAVTNVVGLAIGIAVCVLILLYVRFETSYDEFHEKADRTYRIAGAAAVLIALLTVSYHAIKAALTNSADSLRYE